MIQLNTTIKPKSKLIDVNCICGNTFKVMSTIKLLKLQTELCNKCHPAYTKQSRLVDKAGVVDKFNKKFGNFLK